VGVGRWRERVDECESVGDASDLSTPTPNRSPQGGGEFAVKTEPLEFYNNCPGLF
jgi:hypothetical protein